jgi:GNAT superfamily N-acetyltransferase
MVHTAQEDKKEQRMAIHRLDLTNRRDMRRYIDLPFRLYQKNELWVPPFVSEIRTQLDPQRHPFYQHSDAAFFVVEEQGEVVGRIAVIDNARYNEYHDERSAFFYHFEAVDDRSVSQALFAAAFDWARERGLNTIWGPKGFMTGDGQGLLIEGFEHRPAIGIPYNAPYYVDRVEEAGFEKKLDFLSCYIDQSFDFPRRILRVAEKVRERRGLEVVNFRTRDELREIIPRVAKLYNDSFVEVVGYVPMTEAEAQAVGERMIGISDPALIKLVMHEDEIAGFILAYPDISAAIQRCRGRMWPLGWFHLMREFRRTRWINFNSGGILEEYRGLGGNALLYAEYYRALADHPQYQYGDLQQVQETNTRMVQELEAIGVPVYKRHRLYQRSLD